MFVCKSLHSILTSSNHSTVGIDDKRLMVVNVGDVYVGTLLVDVSYVVDHFGVFFVRFLLLLCRGVFLLLAGMLLIVITSGGHDLGLGVCVSLSVDIHVRYHCLSSNII